ncbi:MAG: MBOAT family protein [Acidobacteria bacterium]|nr:MBOAT family protein [Acidobacteriota bacterium]
MAFFAVVFAVHWSLRRARWRKLWLLAASYAFYAGWDWRFLGLILTSTTIDFIAGRRMEASLEDGVRRRWLIASVVANLGILGLFKYWDFFAESGAAFLAFLGLPVTPSTLKLILPIGISFYTFQTLSYTIDVYRRQLSATDRIVDFALFVAFFPQLVAGPIVRAAELLPQLAENRRFAAVPVKACLTLFLIGYVKKACLADNLASLVDPVFAHPEAAAASSLWLAMFLYGAQIFCDFSGYSDMAIATAGLLGYRLPLNFDAPYIAASVTEFWRRWHISLSSWFRDYLYIPLGGNSGSRARTYANLGLVFLLCGLWHGASWNFVIWGLIHGSYLVGERLLGLRTASGWRALRLSVTTLLVMLAWVPFRSPTLEQAGIYLAGLAGQAGVEASLSPAWWGLIALLGLIQYALGGVDVLGAVERVPAPAFAPAYGLAVAWILPWAAANYRPFIYFQF